MILVTLLLVVAALILATMIVAARRASQVEPILLPQNALAQYFSHRKTSEWKDAVHCLATTPHSDTASLAERVSRDVAALVYHNHVDPTFPADLKILQIAGFAMDFSTQQFTLPILYDGSTIISPLEIDVLFPMFIILDDMYPGILNMDLLTRAKSTEHMMQGFGVKTYRPSWINWVGEFCLVSQDESPFIFLVNGNAVRIGDNQVAVYHTLQRCGVIVIKSYTASVVIVHSDGACSIYVTGCNIYSECSLPTVTPFTANGSTRIYSAPEIAVTFGAAREIQRINDAAFAAGDTDIAIVDDAYTLVNGIDAQLNLVTNNILDTKIVNGKRILYGNDFSI